MVLLSERSCSKARWGVSIMSTCKVQCVIEGKERGWITWISTEHTQRQKQGNGLLRSQPEKMNSIQMGVATKGIRKADANKTHWQDKKKKRPLSLSLHQNACLQDPEVANNNKRKRAIKKNNASLPAPKHKGKTKKTKNFLQHVRSRSFHISPLCLSPFDTFEPGLLNSWAFCFFRGFLFRSLRCTHPNFFQAWFLCFFLPTRMMRFLSGIHRSSRAKYIESSCRQGRKSGEQLRMQTENEKRTHKGASFPFWWKQSIKNKSDRAPPKTFPIFCSKRSPGRCKYYVWNV